MKKFVCYSKLASTLVRQLNLINQMTHACTRLPPITELPVPPSVLASFDSMVDISGVDSLPSEKKPRGGKGPWTYHEDKLLLDAMASFSGHICWEKLSKRIPGRSAKQCRERWQFRLHPDVNKAPFQQWEDDIIIQERVNNGLHWTFIAQKLPGRTSCAVKNRWYTVLRNRQPNKVPRRMKYSSIATSPLYLEALWLRNKELLSQKNPLQQ